MLLDAIGKAHITDFGFMRFTKDGPPYDKGPPSHGSNQRATKTYTAPEMLLHGHGHGPAVDMWALGVIAVELAQNKRLSAATDRTARKQLRRFCACAPPSPRQDLIAGCLHARAAERLTAAAALESPALCGSTLTAVAPETPAKLIRAEARAEKDVAACVAALMQELDFSSPQTFYASCSFAQDARASGGPPAPLDSVALYAVLAAGKLYEHEYWALDEASKLVSVPCSLEASVFFQKTLLQTRKGRLLVPFPTSTEQFSTLTQAGASEKRRHARRARRAPKSRAAPGQVVET